ncbi:MAG: type II secretion system protein [Planctomycetota bacterium]
MREKNAFTLIELLVVIAIIALLMSILMPSLHHARTYARITKAHAELRGITRAMEMYRMDNDEEVPPTRFSCSTRTAYELPVELVGYLPAGEKNGVQIAKMPDPFTPGEHYKYRAVGPAIMNESTLLENAASLWIPDGFGRDEKDTGRYYRDPDESPVRYAVWSMGPDPNSAKFDVPGRLPVPQKYWLQDASDTGAIVHFEDDDGRVHASP